MGVKPEQQPWRVPTPEEVAAADGTERQRRAGPLSWVRKLGIRPNVGARRQVAKAPPIGQPAVSEATSDIPHAASPVASPVPGSELSEERGARDSEVRSASSPSGDGAVASDHSMMPDAPDFLGRTQRRRVRISEKALDRRTRRSGTRTAPPHQSDDRTLTLGPGYGRCSCGEMFYGPQDVVTAGYASHQCGVSRGTDRADWMFDR